MICEACDKRPMKRRTCKVCKGKGYITRVLYVIQAEHFDILKIGISYTPEERLYYMQVGSPLKLNIIYQWDVPVEWTDTLETAIHNKLAKFHSHGERFKLPPVECLNNIVQVVTEHAEYIRRYGKLKKT